MEKPVENNQTEKELLRNNPVFIITIACLIAVVMSVIGFLAYYNSDTRRMVEQLQINNQQEVVESTLAPATGDLNSAYINSLEDGITQAVEKHDDDTEFSSSEITDSALGL